MKIKKVVFTFTGEVRKPEQGEYFRMSDGEVVKSIGIVISPREIYTKEEIEEGWIPKTNEKIYIADVTTESLFYSGNYFDIYEHLLQVGLVFPYTETGKQLAIEKSKQILEFLKSNKD